MANTIKTRILNKISTWSEWESVKTTFKPLRGEICIVEIPTDTTGTGLTPPATGIKVGDGNNFFKDLPWIQAIAGDVTAWCKENMADFDKFKAQVAAAVADSEGGLQNAINGLSQRVTNLEATVNTGDNSNANLRQAINTVDGKANTNAQNITSLTNTKADKTQVATDIATAKTAVLGQKDGANFNGTVMGAYDAAASAAAAAKSANDAIGSTEYVGGTLTAAIAALQDSVGNSSEGLGSQVANLKTRMGQAETAISTKAAQADLTALQGRVTTAEGKITTLEGEMNVVQAATAGYDASKTIASEIQKASEAAASAQSKADANEGKVNTLVGSDANKSVRDIAIGVLTEKLIAENAGEALNTLEEIAAWIQSHPNDAAAMNNAIKAVKQNLGFTGENYATAPETVDKRIADAIDNLDIELYAKAEELASVSARVKTIEDAPYATTANVATAKSEVIGASGDAKDANTIHGVKAYAADVATTAKNQAISTAASAADAKYELKNVAKGLVDALAGKDNTTTVKGNADAIASINAAIGAMDLTDTVNGVVTKVNQADGKITVTHKKITMDEFDPNATFVFYCGTASDVI